MISIYVDNDNKTQKITDWKLRYSDTEGELLLTCHFRSGKTYTRPITACKITPTREVQGKLLTKQGSTMFSAVDKVTIYGEKYAVVYYPGSSKPYVMKVDEVELIPKTTIKGEAIFSYFVAVAKARINHATESNKPIAENVLRQLEKLVPHPDTVLHAYCTGQNQSRKQAQHFIYPFGINESQLNAVEQAFSSQISLIEGPPGTGKTQTILNIVANILLQKKTVAILSNNNAAVENVYEKLRKAELDYLVAKLGSTDNRKGFFANTPDAPSGTPASAPDINTIETIQQKLKLHLYAHNQVAQLQGEIDELVIEQQYLLQWQRSSVTTANASLEKYTLSPQKITDLMAYLTYLDKKRITFKDRIELLLNFRLLRMKPFDDWEKRKSFIYSLQLHYYEKVLQQKKRPWRPIRKNWKTITSRHC